MKKLITCPFRLTWKAIKKGWELFIAFLKLLKEYKKQAKETPHKFWAMVLLIHYIYAAAWIIIPNFYEDYTTIQEVKAECVVVERESELETREVKLADRFIVGTPEERFIKAYQEDKGFKGYIDNMQGVIRRNNPGNLRFHNQPGATNVGGFANFTTPYNGFRALIMQIIADIARNDSIKTFIYDYAPESENDTYKYMLFLESSCGHRDTKLKDLDILHFAVKIVEFEHGIKFD